MRSWRMGSGQPIAPATSSLQTETTWQPILYYQGVEWEGLLWGSAGVRLFELVRQGMQELRRAHIGCINQMEDTLNLPEWKAEELLETLKANPLTQKALKTKLDKIYMITSYNEQEYLKDVVQAYGWIRLACELPTLEAMFEHDRVLKYFLEDFVHTAIRYMVICKKFKMLEMMIMTQQMMVQALRLFMRFFKDLEKYPKMTLILKHVFDIDKVFYKLNYVNEYPYLVVPPTKEEVAQVDAFIDELEVGQQIDVLKSEIQSKRLCWLPATVKKITTMNIYASSPYEKTSLCFDRKSMQVRPFESKKEHYEWRFALQKGDQVDLFNENYTWVHGVIAETRTDEDTVNQQEQSKIVEVRIQGEERWLSLTDAKIQKFNSIVVEGAVNRYSSDTIVDDFNDMLFDPEMTCFCVPRPEGTKSQLFIDLMVYAHKELHMFEKIAETIRNKEMKIEVTADLITFVCIVHTLFHRKFAIEYLGELTDSIIDYITNSKESTIRNFSRERYDAVSGALVEFLKRLKPSEERKKITEKLQLDLILRFLFSDFLDRKLQAVALLALFFKQSKMGTTIKSHKQFIEWVEEHKILGAIYNDKSHSELISRSSDFLKYYLETNPSAEKLEPLLIWNDAIIKLVDTYFEYLPEEISNGVVNRIKEKPKVTNPDALSIMRKTPNCEQWLLQNGGECWVEVVKDRPKKKAFIMQVFEHPFPVVFKITHQIFDLYECTLKTAFFNYLFESNYLCKVLTDEALPIDEKIQFASLTIDLIKTISDDIFEALLPYLSAINANYSKEFQEFFINLLNKLQTSHVKKLFASKFNDQSQLAHIGDLDFKIFQKCFLFINEDSRSIDKTVRYEYPTPHAFRKEKRETLVIKRNPNELLGMDGLLLIVFQNKNISVTMNAIEFIGFLFDHLTEQLKPSVVEFKKNFLDNCLNELYKVSESESDDKSVLQQKYLKILERIMNESEQHGTDDVASVDALFPAQKIAIRVIDYFNVNKTKIYLEVPSNFTLHELRYEIGKHINAYPHEMKMLVNGVELDNRLNGQVLHAIKLQGDIVVEKKGEIARANLTEADGRLVDKAKIIFLSIFKEYSSFGLMSKKQCQKYHQKCVGDTTTMGQAKVQKIYEQYDSNKDGYLTEQDFLRFYETSARNKESAVWSNLETFGIRNDLEILSDLQITYADKSVLTRYLLFENEKFMKILFEMLSSSDRELAGAAWVMAARLPLYQNFPYEADVNKEYLTRYWLYVIDDRKQYEKLTHEILKGVLKMSLETACMGLKVANECSSIDIEIFQIILENLQVINSEEEIDFLHKVVLDNSLQIVSKGLGHDQAIKDFYLDQQKMCNQIFREGIMSANSVSRTMYSKALEEIIEHSIEADLRIFEGLFNLVYKIFDNCDRSTLTIEYFDLFSSILEMLCIHDELMEKLGLNWSILTHSIIQLYKTHECTETSMNSKADQVAQGLLRIISKLLNYETIDSIVELVPFIFQKSLFPENGRNKLKNSKSRQDAYQLIYEICKYQKSDNQLSGGLEKLFESGFKDIYKKMSSKKAETFSYSYYYSYNEARSELGYAGIRNLGCICYMISMIQQLYMTAPFRNLILMADDKEPECLVKRGTKEIDDNIFHQFQKMFSHLLLTEKQEYNPDDFCYSFKDFDGQPINVSIQQDAQEFLNLFFDKMETSLKNTPFSHIFENIYGGKTCSQMSCSGCNAVKERSESFYPLSLEIKGFKSIDDSFKKYIQGEVISDYQCDSCNQKCDVTKRNFLEKTPNYFIVHLQRMCFNYDKLENEKVNSRWEFPNELNVYDYTLAKEKGLPEQNEEFTYKLKGIVLHYGTADFGHYFSYIRESQNQWIEFNDERVREFDPNDIEVDCFGGEHWRRESQSAYLLVYEREKKSDLILEFNNEEEKRRILSELKLTNAIVEDQPTKPQDLMEEKEEKEIDVEKSTEKELESESVTEEGENKEKKEEKVLVRLDMKKIPQFVPKEIKEKIDKENDEFSFTMNLSNDEFALFIYHILSIDPPETLKSEYLELCYECFHLKQMLMDEEEKSINIAEWAATRFKELIDGHGWQFLKSFGQNWDADILSIEKPTRTVIKSLLECVVSDIIKTYNFNSELEETEVNESAKEKREVIYEFLEKMSDMMLGEVNKHWPRFKEYFALWVSLVKNNEFVRRYCEEKMLVEKILDFVMDTGFPEPRNYKRYPMGNQYYSAEFEHPLELMQTLLSYGYELNELEEKCRRTYAFMDKIITYRVEGANMIAELCKNDQILSEKMGYMLLNKSSSVNQSDHVKPVIASIHEYLSIDDALRPLRVEWLIGFPYYIEHERTGSFGSYGIHPDTDYILNYVSALGQPSILQQITKFKAKTQHVAALLIIMILDMEREGLIHNLDEYPSRNCLDKCYTSWFQTFVDNYYDDTHRPFTARNYMEYGDRLKMAWTERPNRPVVNPYPQILIGKSIEGEVVSTEASGDIFEISQINIKSYYLELNEETNGLTGKNIKQIKTADKFISPNLPRQVTAYGHHNNFMRLQSSDEEETEENPNEAIFEKTKEAWLLRKITITNHSAESAQAVLKVGAKECNLHVPKSPMSAEIKGESSTSFTLIKKNIAEDFGELEIELKNLGVPTRTGYWPRQLLTEVEQRVEDDNKVSSDEEDDTDAWH